MNLRGSGVQVKGWDSKLLETGSPSWNHVIVASLACGLLYLFWILVLIVTCMDYITSTWAIWPRILGYFQFTGLLQVPKPWLQALV